jgi:hypothetical protein
MVELVILQVLGVQVAVGLEEALVLEVTLALVELAALEEVLDTEAAVVAEVQEEVLAVLAAVPMGGEDNLSNI